MIYQEQVKIYRMASYLRNLNFTFIITFLLVGCAATQPTSFMQVSGNVDDLDGLRAMRVQKKSNDGSTINPIRLTALKEAGMTVGTQSGLVWRTKRLNHVLKRNSDALDRIFNFQAMLLPNSVLPPVLVEAEKSLHLASDQTIRLADHMFQIHQQARFVSTAPRWRDYLWMDFPDPSTPDPSMLPQNPLEETAWQTFVTEGWYQGIRQANIIYRENLNTLRRDYTGMALYRKLLAQGMVSKPFVARSSLGITGNSSTLRINDRVLRITSLPALSPNSARWDPAVIRKMHLRNDS